MRAREGGRGRGKWSSSFSGGANGEKGSFAASSEEGREREGEQVVEEAEKREVEERGERSKDGAGLGPRGERSEDERHGGRKGKGTSEEESEGERETRAPTGGNGTFRDLSTLSGPGSRRGRVLSEFAGPRLRGVDGKPNMNRKPVS